MKQLLLITIMLTLISGCRLEELHLSDDDDPTNNCTLLDINGISNYESNGRAFDIIKTGDTYIVCGSIESTSNTFLMEIDADGNSIFFQTQDYPFPASYKAKSVVQIKEGGYLICGNVETTGNKQAFFAKCDSGGTLLDYTLGEIGTHCEHIAYFNEKDYIFVGYKTNTNNEDIYVGKVENVTSPNITTTEYLDSRPGNQKVYTVEAANNGGFLFAGHEIVNGKSTPYVFYLDSNLNPPDTPVLQAYTNPQGIDEIYIRCMTKISDDYMFAGSVKTDDIFKAFILKMNNDYTYGDLDIIDSDTNVQIYGIAEVEENYIICGNKKTDDINDSPIYAYALKLSETGTTLDTYTYGDTTPTDEGTAGIVVVDKCNYMMAGYAEDTTDGPKILVVKIND